MNPEWLARIAASTDHRILTLLERWQAGELTDAEFEALVTAVIERGQAEAYAVADVGVATTLGIGAVGLLPPLVARVRARRAARLIARELPALLGEGARFGIGFNVDKMRAELAEPGHDREWYRIRNTAIKYAEQAALEGRAEVLATGQEANGAAIRAHRAGWRRAPNSGACEVCTDLARSIDGAMPPDTEMWSHKGCGCTQKPVAQTSAA